jgi:integrase/recombinase XerD
VSLLRQTAEEYLAMRRSLGYKLQPQGRLLLDFVDYLQHTGAPTITAETALAWATQPVGAAPIWWNRRLSVVRCFARHLQTLDPACQVPPTDLLPAPYQRITRTCIHRQRSRHWCTRPESLRCRCRPPLTRR